MQWDLAIGVVGTVASLCSLLISQPNWKSRTIHLVYSAALVLVIYLMTSRSAEISAELKTTQQKLVLIESIQHQAAGLLPTIPFSSSDDGTNRGTVLKVLSFLEKHKSELPETYGIVKKLADGAGLTEGAKPYLQGGKEQSESLEQAAKGVRAIVEGLAAGAK